jgi:hypothetical protein
MREVPEMRFLQRIALSIRPPASTSSADTSLRYTDILFGFVIKELFTRLQNWPSVNWTVKAHLLVGTTLVLGSWIGYRRSLNRTSYDVKFFNLPFFRFLADQLMLILYFRIAVITNVDGTGLPDDQTLATHTASLVVAVFALYLVWDALAIWMVFAKTDGGAVPLYPKVGDDGKKTTERQKFEPAGICITAFFLSLVSICWCRSQSPESLWILVAILLGYRWVKEVRTSWTSA